MSERQVRREHTYTCHNATTRLLHNTNYSKSANKSLAKAWDDSSQKNAFFWSSSSANHIGIV